MRTKERINLEFNDAKNQIDHYTDKALQLQKEYCETFAKFKVGEHVIANTIGHPQEVIVMSRIAYKSVFAKGLLIRYTLLKVKKDGTPSKQLYSSSYSEEFMSKIK